MKKLLMAAVGMMAFGSVGCATLFAPKMQTVAVQSSPADAEVYIDGAPRGRTPLTLELKPNKTYTVVIKKPGYADQTHVLTNSVGAQWIILDVLGGLLPIVIDAGTGSWYQLDTSVVNAPLSPTQAPAPTAALR